MTDFSTESLQPWPHRDGWARWISDIFNPIFAPVFLVLILLWEQVHVTWPKLTGSALALLFFAIIPLFILFYFRSSGRISDLDMVTRQKRVLPYLLALVSYTVGIYWIYQLQLDNHTVVLTLLFCFLLNSTVGFMITLVWKISIHSASLSTVVTFAWLMYHYRIIDSPTALFGIAIVGTITLPALAWARWHLRVHSTAQLIWGILIAAILTLVETYWLLL
jgi:hypothetical protein